MTTAMIVITVKFIAPNTSNASIELAQHLAHDIPCLSPCRHAARPFPHEPATRQSRGFRHRFNPHIFHGVN